jgi:hypothetical protein
MHVKVFSTRAAVKQLVARPFLAVRPIAGVTTEPLSSAGTATVGKIQRAHLRPPSEFIANVELIRGA